MCHRLWLYSRAVLCTSCWDTLHDTFAGELGFPVCEHALLLPTCSTSTGGVEDLRARLGEHMIATGSTAMLSEGAAPLAAAPAAVSAASYGRWQSSRVGEFPNLHVKHH
jgi:hypothetical protein